MPADQKFKGRLDAEITLSCSRPNIRLVPCGHIVYCVSCARSTALRAKEDIQALVESQKKASEDSNKSVSKKPRVNPEDCVVRCPLCSVVVEKWFVHPK